MAFIIDKEELKPGLILFRRADVAHRNWYCRVKLPKADRYKTVSLKTSDVQAARALAWDQDGDVRYALKHGVAIFNRSFREVAREYLLTQEARAKRGEITPNRVKTLQAVINGALESYVGSTQVHLIGDELWNGYPAWRRVNGRGRHKRNGTREVSKELSEQFAAREADIRARALKSRGIRAGKALIAKPVTPTPGEAVAIISDSTIRYEMAVFAGVMNHAIKKRYVEMTQRFQERPKLKVMRRDEFTIEEYRKLHVTGRNWIKDAVNASSEWYRTVVYNMILIACNTGMRPSELKNLRWRDVMSAKDREGRDIVVMFVQGKGKSRKLVAPKAVGDYIERIHAIAKATDPEDRVFTTITGQPAITLYKHLIDDILTKANLRTGPDGVQRSTYCFRHSYATFRLHEGVDVYFLAEQMGTSVKMIEDHYGHVNTVRHADRVLQGMHGWEPAEQNETEAKAKAAKGAAARGKTTRPASSRPKKTATTTPSATSGQRRRQR